MLDGSPLDACSALRKQLGALEGFYGVTTPQLIAQFPAHLRVYDLLADGEEEEEEELIEDASELGEDEDDMAEVIDNVEEEEP